MANYELGPAMLLMEDLETASTTTDAAATASDTTISVSDSSSFPERGIVTIGSEEILYMENDTTNNDLKQCIRGFRGTTAAAITSGATVTLTASDLGKTFGGVTLTVSENSQQIKTDQDGDSPVDESITGTVVTVDANLADISLSNFAMTHKTTVQGSTGSQRVEVKPNVGSSLMDSAKKLIIVPYAGATVSDDDEKLVTLPKAGIKSAEQLQYDSSNQRVIKVQFVGYPDTANNLLIFGLEA